MASRSFARIFYISLTFVASLFSGIAFGYADQTIILASTTSTQNSGLFDYLLPKFKEQTNITVNVVAVGTGAALKLARKGDADVLMVHHKTSEEQFVAEGYGVKRYNLMHNDFVLLGPKSDPAQIKSIKSISKALKEISTHNSIFLSRGDDSGTHKRELELWRQAGIAVKSASGGWYREAGAGMGATLNIAAAMNGYVLADRATWISFKNKQSLKVLLAGDKGLFNQYGVILVNPDKHPHVKQELGQTFIDWLLSEHGQKSIENYKLSGQQLFIPDGHLN